MSLVSSNKVETNRAELVIEVKGEVFTKAVDAAFRKNVKKIAVPGFRKGKAPRAMIEKVYGKGFFLEEAMNDLYPEAYTAAVDEADIVPVDMPEIEVIDLNDEGFTFKATVTTKPVATVGEYKGLTAEKGVAEVADEQLDDRIDQIRERYARVIAVEDRAAKLGDIAEIDFEGFKDGVAFDGGKGENHPLTLGSGSFIPGFEDQIVGHNIGDEFDVNVTFPEDYAEASLAGAPTVFKVKINALKERQLPELDDEFAKDVSEFDTFEEYKADLKAKMLETAQAQVDAEFENKLLEQVVALLAQLSLLALDFAILVVELLESLLPGLLAAVAQLREVTLECCAEGWSVSTRYDRGVAGRAPRCTEDVTSACCEGVVPRNTQSHDRLSLRDIYMQVARVGGIDPRLLDKAVALEKSCNADSIDAIDLSVFNLQPPSFELFVHTGRRGESLRGGAVVELYDDVGYTLLATMHLRKMRGIEDVGKDYSPPKKHPYHSQNLTPHIFSH